MRRLFALLAASLAAPAVAQPVAPPKLLLVIAVDQLSTDLFNEYRPHWTGGMKRLMSEGAVFPQGYQSHAATETCPGHSTILTGVRPARNGITANGWIDQSLAREDKQVNCAEDPTLGKSSSGRDYVPAHGNLRVPTLGERMKLANPATRVVAVAGKDRAAMMMAGRTGDQIWFLRPSDYVAFETLRAATTPRPAAVDVANAGITAALAQPRAAYALPKHCEARALPVALPGRTIGTGRFERAAGARLQWRGSPESDVAVMGLATSLIDELQLGKRDATDVLAIGLSATDVVGHGNGTAGAEMCIQLGELDRLLGELFTKLDRQGIDYTVALTADHGGHDAPERNRAHALPDAQRVDAKLTNAGLSKSIEEALKLKTPALVSAESMGGSIQIGRDVPRGRRAAVLKRAADFYRAQPQVAGVFTAAEIAATPMPTTQPETWTLIERIKASWVPGRSGDLEVALKPRVTPIATPGMGYVATHGSPWDYDRRVPILFWRKGLGGFEQPNGVETVDIAPTLAALIGLNIPAGEFDGRCLDLDVGAPSICR